MSEDNTLGTPNLLAAKRAFIDVRVLIAHSHRPSALLVKTVLDQLGCSTALAVAGPEECLRGMHRTPPDILCVDEHFDAADAIGFVRKLRSLLSREVRAVPVIYFSSRSDRESVEIAMAAGVSEYVRKPYSGRGLLTAVHAVIEEPRAFILSPDYVGPDRRGVVTGLLGSDRAVLTKRRPETIAPVESLSRLLTSHAALTFPPDLSLKKKVGIDVSSDEATWDAVIAESERSLTVAKDVFIVSLQSESAQLLQYIRMLFQYPALRQKMIASIEAIAIGIEASTRAGGYPKVAAVAELLAAYCRQNQYELTDLVLLVVEKHAVALAAALSAIRQSGGVGIVEELVRDLHTSISKLTKPKSQYS